MQAHTQKERRAGRCCQKNIAEGSVGIMQEAMLEGYAKY